MIPKLELRKPENLLQTIGLWLIYLAIGGMVYYMANSNLGLPVVASAGIGLAVVAMIVALSEFLDRKYGWTKEVNDKEKKSKPEPLTASEYIQAHPETGARALIRGFVEQGGKAEEIQAELTKK